MTWSSSTGVGPADAVDTVRRAYTAARTAQSSWAALQPAARSRILLAVSDLLLERRDTILDLVQNETGKARMNALEELLDAAVSIRYYARKAPGLLRPRLRPGALPVLTRTREFARPRGVVAVITPWNYPLALAADVIPALLAGNAVVNKPDSRTRRSSLVLRELAVEAGLDPELWQVVLGDPAEVGPPLIEGADFVAFTGSTRAGRAIARQCADRLIGYNLELAGKNPMIVLDDADLDRTVTAALRACFGNAGQLCVGIERIYVDNTVLDDFLRRFVRATDKLRLGTALDYTFDVGPLIDADRLSSVSAMVDRAVAAGATVATGGRARPDVGPCFYQPTILTGAAEESEVSTEEVFGPVVTVAGFTDQAEAIRLANAGPYGMNAAVFGRDVRRARRIADQLEVGMVNINEGYAAGYGSAAPLGGRKQSGTGRRHGAQGLLQYTESQIVSSQHLVGFDPPAGLDSERYSQVLTDGVRLLRRLKLR
jgi:succinate-semialdehyde dehydrogenase/glutarate-semialdehyde dehydrogenase